MSLLSLIGIGVAQAATSAPTGTQSVTGEFMSMAPMLIIFLAVFYFLIIRPQSRRSKEQKQLLEQLTVGDEVVTIGGIVGRLSKLRDNFVVLTIAKDTEITIQKSSISAVIPKGTMESVE